MLVSVGAVQLKAVKVFSSFPCWLLVPPADSQDPDTCALTAS